MNEPDDSRLLGMSWAGAAGRRMRHGMKRGGIYPKVVTLPLAEALSITSPAFAGTALILRRVLMPPRSAPGPVAALLLALALAHADGRDLHIGN
jgi:hypothetical protein